MDKNMYKNMKPTANLARYQRLKPDFHSSIFERARDFCRLILSKYCGDNRFLRFSSSAGKVEIVSTYKIDRHKSRARSKIEEWKFGFIYIRAATLLLYPALTGFSAKQKVRN